MKEIYRKVKEAREKGKLACGVNQVAKLIEKNKAKLVIIARDVKPKVIVKHIPHYCKKNGVKLIYVASKSKLGRNAGLPVASSSVVILK